MADALGDMGMTTPSDPPSTSYPADGGSMLDGAPPMPSEVDNVDMTDDSGDHL